MEKEKLPGIKLFDMTGQAAVITGGSKGLGLAMAAGLASAGANLMLVSRHGREADIQAKQLEADYGIKAISFEGDVTSEEDMIRMAQVALDEFGKIDVLINSAGINIRGPIDELSHKEFKQVMGTNVEGTWLAIRAVVPVMKKAKKGKIINVASTLGLVGIANRTPYTSSKGAIVQMTRALGIELAPFQINVNALCPGPFLTDMNIPIANTEEGRRIIVGATALERWAELKEIQGAALLLASEASSYMTGSMVTVDGGWTAR